MKFNPLFEDKSKDSQIFLEIFNKSFFDSVYKVIAVEDTHIQLHYNALSVIKGFLDPVDVQVQHNVSMPVTLYVSIRVLS